MRNIFKLLALVLVLSACSEDVLNVKNQNDPDTGKVLAEPTDLINVIKGGALSSWGNFHDFGFHMMSSVMADYNTSSWGNAAMRDMSNEPRNLWNNSKAYGSSYVTEEQYNEAYGVIHQVNNVLNELSGEVGDQLGDDKALAEAFGYFLLGQNYGSLGRIFDKAVIVKPGEEPSVETYVFAPYSEVVAYAMECYEKAISIAQAAPSIDYSGWYNGANIDKDYFIAMCNSYMARLLTTAPRNAAENASVDWARVKTLAQAGIDNDFVIMNDGDQWRAWYVYINRPGWARTDPRIVNAMASEYPARFPSDGSVTSLPEPTSPEDARITTDFTYVGSVPFRPNRGYYHFSNYVFSRYDPVPNDLAGPLPTFLVAEVNAMQAEACARTGDLAGAIAIINAGERVTRGGLPALDAGASLDDVLAAIQHERDIELNSTGPNLPWYDMRRSDRLQEGSLLHFPVPGSELEVLQLEDYSFGSAARADGVNTSNGGWF